MDNDFFVFNNIKSTDKNIILLNYSTAFLPANKRSFINIPGKDGSLPTGDKSKQDIIVSCEVAMLGDTDDMNYLNSWLSQRGELRFWDMLDKYYIGEVVGEIPTIDKDIWKEFTINFRCYPIKYGFEKTYNLTNGSSLRNLGTYPTKGIITIELTADVDHIEAILLNTGEFVYLEHGFATGDVIKIDLEKEIAYKNDYSIMSDCYLESDFFEIPVGKFEITVSSGNATLSYVERWL